MKLTKELIESMAIQVLKRTEMGYTSEELLNEMRDSFTEMFEESGVAQGKEAKVAGKEFTLKIMKAITKQYSPSGGFVIANQTKEC